MSITKTNRRGFLIGASSLALTACMATPNYNALDQAAIVTKERLFANYPDAKRAAEDAAGYLIFPKVQKAGLIVGGSTGVGTLFSKNNIIGHYELSAASIGLQAGIQEFSLAIFFMTPEAMANFRAGQGIEYGTDIEYALPKYGAISIGASSATYNKPVYALIFNQSGVMVGATLRGAKYSQI